MPCVAQFGIIDEIDKTKDYGFYEPEKYHCVSINDDILNDWWPQLSIMKSYFHKMERPGFGLARWGVTLIPPESLNMFYDIITNYKGFKKSEGLSDLAYLIHKAKIENKFVIHFGV